MTEYTPPTAETRFVLSHVLELEKHADLPGFADLDDDLIEALLGEASRFCAEVIAPLNRVSDQQGCTRADDGSVSTPDGFRAAYASYVEAGWGTLALPAEYGGQEMPHVMATVVEEYLNSSCHAFNMYAGLTHGAVAAIMACGSDELKAAYLPKLVSGEWLGTMALTEAHCGTDLGLIRTKAEMLGDGSYSIRGEKIFCSGGEQDLTDNIIHLVLARLPDAPAGPRGISLFVVPKFMPETGERNAATCGSIEHKMGVNGSATCVMNFDGATGFLVGAENAGLTAMFIMMNSARLSCGNQGLAQAELAYQKASAYALDRCQGRSMGERVDPEQAADPIIVHPDVRRMLMDAKGFTEGFRALIAWTALQIDRSHGAANDDERAQADQLVGFLTPVLKAFGTDMGFQTAVEMQQIFGGHGYVSEWGVEQIVRDARVAMIYEGANGVQALDLAARKLARDGGAAAELFFSMVEADCQGAPDEIAGAMTEALAETRSAAAWLIENSKSNPQGLAAGSYAFLQMIGYLATGWMWAKMAKSVSGASDGAFNAAKLVTARHYAQSSLPQMAGLRRKVEAGGEAIMALAPEQFLRS